MQKAAFMKISGILNNTGTLKSARTRGRIGIMSQNNYKLFSRLPFFEGLQRLRGAVLVVQRIRPRKLVPNTFDVKVTGDVRGEVVELSVNNAYQLDEMSLNRFQKMFTQNIVDVAVPVVTTTVGLYFQGFVSLCTARHMVDQMKQTLHRRVPRCETGFVDEVLG